MAIVPFKVIPVTHFGINRKLIYDFLSVINSNLSPILHRFRDIAFDRPKIAIFATPLGFNSPDGGVHLERSPYNFLCTSTDGQGDQRRRKIAENLNRLTECTNATDDRQTTDGRAIAYSEREPEFTFAKRHILRSEIANCTLLRAVVLTQYRRVTDGQTDIRTKLIVQRLQCEHCIAL